MDPSLPRTRPCERRRTRRRGPPPGPCRRRRSAPGLALRRRAAPSRWSSLRELCDDRHMRVLKTDRKERTKSVAEIFSGNVETFTAVGGEDSNDLRLPETHLKAGARNRWHLHSTA